MERLLLRARRTRWITVCVVNLRILIGFAFLPAGLKKLLAQPFTDPQNTGRFHEFLHAFHATGWFYQLVGIMQLTAAALLFTQRFATLGALLVLPTLTAIVAFCWSTHVYPTATVATLMLLGTLALVLWDYPKWKGVFAADDRDHQHSIARIEAPIDIRLWQVCGIAIAGLYLGVCVLLGEVYRPRGVRPDEPASYVFPLIMMLPIITFAIDQARIRRSASAAR
jgi:uncharacterized membrane protein YphA (DoxX/SURF4 family)